MLRFLPVPFLLFAGACFCQKSIDILHYKYELVLSDRNDSIYGIAGIKLLALEDLAVIELDLAGIARSGKGMKAVNILNDTAHLSFAHQADKLLIRMPVKKKDSAYITIHYKGIPADGLVISRNKFGRRTFFSDNWPDRAHHWIPCVDDPADKAPVEFIITAPDHYKVISNGSLVEEVGIEGNKKRTHWNERVPLPTKIMVIGVADFAISNEGMVNGIPVSTWVFPQNKEKGFRDYGPAKDILSFFIKNIGPYPYEKLANVQSKTIFGGMENASVIFYNELYVNGEQDQHRLIAHEVAHQWFGDMVTEKSFSHLWLSEGFASYLATFYMEKQFGIDTATAILQEDRRKVIEFVKRNNNPVVDTLSSYMSLLNANSYEKGTWLLHMLRKELGDAIFFQAIRRYYQEYAGKNADTRDFQHVVEKTSRKNLSVFFQQWLYTGGIPALDIQWEYSPTDKKVLLTVKQLQKNIFQFPLELLLQTSNKNSQLKKLQVSKPTETFSIPVTSKPIHIKPDPGVSLLYEGKRDFKELEIRNQQ